MMGTVSCNHEMIMVTSDSSTALMSDIRRSIVSLQPDPNKNVYCILTYVYYSKCTHMYSDVADSQGRGRGADVI
jgi:hypothetical protein